MLEIKKVSLLSSLDDILTSDQANIQINTINAHSYNVARKDTSFAEVLLHSDFLLPDGQSVVWAKNILCKEKLSRIAGDDLFRWEMERLNNISGKCFFLGSSLEILTRIKEKASIEYPNVQLKFYSPPFKPLFSVEDNSRMIEEINQFQPDVLFVGMTAPKQEKWVYEHKSKLFVSHICSVGAVFDFYIGNIDRAPKWMQEKGLEWLFRLFKEPRRMWRRYIIGNTKFIYYIFVEKFS
ncbi:WecB/TagA/CpsF family glycosyltransferase [Dysgonomonas sp. ZJ709]|uniref:WecB/TagA/CpsF family glycosyltransferase n=1 Tax=Dysgonomonas sp. ZJ709 TaxID=2709797 RepID=UPI0013E9B16B|nr:WecB/TagA/CpsF family glycosyltransferase [Dysgonomonas sp. ZJ709]